MSCNFALGVLQLDGIIIAYFVQDVNSKRENTLQSGDGPAAVYRIRLCCLFNARVMNRRNVIVL